MRLKVALENSLMLSDKVAIQSSIELWSERCICAPATLPCWRFALLGAFARGLASSRFSTDIIYYLMKHKIPFRGPDKQLVWRAYARS